MIPSFDDFLKTLTPDIMNQIGEDINLKLEQARSKITEDDPNFVGTQVSAIALTTSLEILGCYHKWIQERLADQLG